MSQFIIIYTLRTFFFRLQHNKIITVSCCLALMRHNRAVGCMCDNDSDCIYQAIKSEMLNINNLAHLEFFFFNSNPASDRVIIFTSLNFISAENSSQELLYYQWYPFSVQGELGKLFPPIFRLSMDPLNALPFIDELFNQYSPEDTFPIVTITINCTSLSLSNLVCTSSYPARHGRHLAHHALCLTPALQNAL